VSIKTGTARKLALSRVLLFQNKNQKPRFFFWAKPAPAKFLYDTACLLILYKSKSFAKTKRKETMMIYIEFGLGNESFVNSEIENEVRQKGIVRIKNLKDVYVRIWIKKKVLVLSLKDGIKIVDKGRVNLKLIFGVKGEGYV
jgi:hypothetical protein